MHRGEGETDETEWRKEWLGGRHDGVSEKDVDSEIYEIIVAPPTVYICLSLETLFCLDYYSSIKQTIQIVACNLWNSSQSCQFVIRLK